MDWDGMGRQWQAVLDAVARLDGEVSSLVVEKPASEREVKAVERELGMALPASLRDTFLSFSRRVHFFWYLPEDLALPALFHFTKWGGLALSLDGVLDVESSRLELIEYLQSIEAEPHVMATWEKKLPFHRIANGDRLAIDLSTPGLESVVYIVHDPYDTPGSKLGVDFQDFLARWSALGCPGPERWLWEAFCEGQDSIMDPNGTNAALWRQAIGLNL